VAARIIDWQLVLPSART
jgi:hypothetical protein